MWNSASTKNKIISPSIKTIEIKNLIYIIVGLKKHLAGMTLRKQRLHWH